ncbi:hypothetical protein Golomagni_03039 [Golovinomyces magnicellulatus]|nr:hypothetical protein Golomagni_03039 [Golovinomyces magnicellulatus]
MLSQKSHMRLEKSSLYLPAVLRPTEPPRRVERELNPPPSPGRNNSSLWNTITAESTKRGFDNETGQRKSFDALSVRSLGTVTGPPTRVHWKPDPFSDHCDVPSAQCKIAFTTFRRRHHCRRCGLIFCHQHSLYSVPLDQDANFHPYGTQVRSCESCWIQWNRWIERQSSTIAVKKAEPRDCVGLDSVTSPRDFSPTLENTQMCDEVNETQVSVELGQSVPKDWNWSTF